MEKFVFCKGTNRLSILERFAETRVLLIGVLESAAVCEKIVGAVRNERCRNFCGRTRSLVELLELINLSRLLISNDNRSDTFCFTYADTDCGPFQH
jgi:hypothetical protein